MTAPERLVHGFAADGYGEVADAFCSAVDASTQGGAALTVMVNGQTAVEMWGGSADLAGNRPWVKATPTVLMSCTKGLLALAVARLVEAGMIDLDAPVDTYWPEFGQAGKRGVPVRWLLSHQVGLPYPVRDLTKADLLAWDPVVTALAGQAPLWTPGQAWTYHAMTYGWLVGEVVRRVTGQTVKEAVEQLVTGPVGASAWFGVPREHLSTVAEVTPIPGLAELFTDTPRGRELMRTFTLGGAFPLSVAGDNTGFNDPDIQTVGIPGAGAFGTATALAAIWTSSIVATPTTRPLDHAILADMTNRQTFGPPFLPGGPTARWATGFMIDTVDRPFLTPSSFGHDGAGGQLAFADPSTGVGFGFVTNDLHADDARALGILAALRRTL